MQTIKLADNEIVDMGEWKKNYSPEFYSDEKETKYDEGESKTTKLIFEQIQYLTREFEKHHASTATKEDIVHAEENVKDSVCSTSEETRAVIKALHAELKSSSLRKRLIFNTFSITAILTGLLLCTWIWGDFEITSMEISVLLIGSLAFFFMAHLVPDLKSLDEEEK
jgi:hypothetical protein